MVVQRGDLACCVRCAGPTSAERLARRQLLKAAVHPPAPGPLGQVRTAWTAAAGAVQTAVARTGAGPSGTVDPERDDGEPARTPAAFPGVLTGTVLDTSPQVITICGPDGERRIALPPGAVVWKGRTTDPTALESGDSVVVRTHPGQRSVAGRIWANVGRVTGLIVERDRESMLVDVGRTTGRQAVLIPPHAMGRLQVRFPRLEPGYLVDFIGLRGRGFLEALVPATSQPAYRASEAPGPGHGARPRRGPRRGVGRVARDHRPRGRGRRPVSGPRPGDRLPRAATGRELGARGCPTCRWAACWRSATSARAGPGCSRCPAAPLPRRSSAIAA